MNWTHRVRWGLAGSALAALGMAAVQPAASLAQETDGPASFGCMVPSQEELAKRSFYAKSRAAARQDRPRRVVLTRYLPPIGNQGRQSSCVGWSSAYYAGTYIMARNANLAKEQIASMDRQGSPAFVYNQRPDRVDASGRPIDPGMYISTAVEILKKTGLGFLSDMPYSDRDNQTLPPESAKGRAQRYRLLDAELVGRASPTMNVDALKDFMAETRNPMVVGMFTNYEYQTVRNAPDDYVFTPKELPQGQGAHAMAVVGYDDDKRALLIANSWGTRWGAKGFCWVSDRYVQNCCYEAWGFRKMSGPVARVFSSGDDRPSEKFQFFEVQTP